MTRQNLVMTRQKWPKVANFGAKSPNFRSPQLFSLPLFQLINDDWLELIF